MGLKFFAKIFVCSLCLGLFLYSVPFLSSAEKKLFDDQEVGKITTTSAEAYQYYSEGRKYHLQGDYRQSITFMEKAIAIDPEFAMAYRSMATAYNNIGYSSEWKKYIQKALEASDKVSEKEKYIIQGDFYDQYEKTYDKAIEAYEKLLNLDPKSLWRMNLGIIYRNIEEQDKAIEIFEWLRQKKDTSALNYANLADSYMSKGLFDKAREILEEYQNMFGKNSMIQASIAYSYVYQGKLDLALAETDKAISIDPTNPDNFLLKGTIYRYMGNLTEAEKFYQKVLELKEPMAHYNGWRYLAALYLEQGKFVKAKEQIKQAIAWAEKSGEMESKAWSLGYLALLYSATGNHEQALKEIEDSWNTALASDLTYYQRFNLFWKGIVYANMKSLEKAQEAAEEFRARVDKGMNKKEIRYYYALMGRIELERGNFSKAIEYISKALPLESYGPLNQFSWFLETLALAYYRSGDLDKAKEECQGIATLTEGRFWMGDTYTKSFYTLGKIYEQKGEKARAAEYYQKFLDLWKDADPGIPEVVDAKKRLAGVKG